MTAPIYTLSVRFIERFEADEKFRRDMQRCQPGRYEASREIIRIFDAADRKCPRGQDDMSADERGHVVDRCMGRGQRREAAE